VLIKCDKTDFILSAIQLEANLYVEFKRVIGRQYVKNSFDLPSFGIQVITPCRCNDQTGFIPGRYIGGNCRPIYDILHFTEENDIPGILLLIDFEKAFDSPTLLH
jgi:hypothetical protein